jgi:hypothetical protein
VQINNKAIQDAKAAVTEAHLNLNRVRYEEVSKCQHSNVAESEHRSDAWGGASDPPMRVCLDCGLVEVGWGPGYLILIANALSSISRDDVYGIRSVHFYNDDKGPLLRKEVTVQQLLSQKLGVSP